MTESTDRGWLGAKRFRYGSLLLAAALMAASCTSSSSDDGATGTTGASGDDAATETTADAGEPQRGGEIVVGIVSESNSWYPPEAEWAFSAGNLVADAFYENLYMRAGDGQMIAYLADGPAVPNDDGTEWTVTLRPGITFHDGTPLNADALVEMSALWDEGRFATPGEGIDQTIKVDDLTVTYTLFEADPAFEATLAGNRGVAFSPTAARAFGEDAAEHPVGTGPFVFQSWVRDSEIVTTRNPNYWQAGQPYVDQLSFRVLVDSNSRLASLESGDLDLVTQGGVNGLAPLVDKGYTPFEHFGSGAGLIVYNTLNPPMDDVRVRRAVAYAIDPEDTNAINPGRLSGELERRSQFYAPSSPWYTPTAEDLYAYFDVAQAQSLIDEYVNDPARSDGKATGEPIAFGYVCTPTPANRLTSQLFLQAWDDIGLEVDFTEEEQGTMITRVVGGPTQDPPFLGDFHATCWADGNDQDPLPLYDSRFGEVGTNVLNFSNYTDPFVTEQIDILRESIDSDTRFAASTAIAEKLAEDMPVHWWGSGSTVVMASEKVKNIDNFTWPDGTDGSRMDRGRVMWTEVFVDGAEPLDIPLGLVELPDVPAVTTTTEAAAPEEEAGPNDTILAVLPGPPEGFQDTDPSFIFQQCPGGVPADGLSPLSITVKSFTGGTDFGPYSGIVVFEFPEGEAEQYMANYAANVAGPCASYNDVAASGAPLTQAQAPMDGPALGDESASYAVRGDSAGFPVNTDQRLVRRGNLVTQTYWLVIGGEPDAAATAAFATEVDAAIATLG